MSLEEQWWRDLIRTGAPFVAGWLYLAVGLLFLSAGLVTHKNYALLSGVLGLVASAINFGLWAARRHRERSRPDSEK